MCDKPESVHHACMNAHLRATFNRVGDISLLDCANIATLERNISLGRPASNKYREEGDQMRMHGYCCLENLVRKKCKVILTISGSLSVRSTSR